MALAAHVTKSKATTFFIDENCLPQTIAVARTRAEPLGWTIAVGDPFKDLRPDEVFGALFQYPGVTGVCHDFSGVIASLHDAKAIAVVAADLSRSPCSSRREKWAPMSPWLYAAFWNAHGLWRPHAGYIAVKDAYKRALPGRLVGVSVDSRGNRAYRSRCKRANSISVARAPPLISARRRFCPPLSPRCMRCSTAQRA